MLWATQPNVVYFGGSAGAGDGMVCGMWLFRGMRSLDAVIEQFRNDKLMWLALLRALHAHKQINTAYISIAPTSTPKSCSH